MRKFYFIFLCILGLVLYVGPAYAQKRDVVSQKQELEKIKQEIETSRQNLDSLRAVEKNVLKQISDYEQKENMNKTVLRRLNNQLGSLRKNIDNSKNDLEFSEKKYTTSKGRYVDNLKYYYAATQTRLSGLENDFGVEKDNLIKRIYLRALSLYDREVLENTEDQLSMARNEYSGLLDEKSKVDKAASQKRREYTVISAQKESSEKDLSRLRQRKETEADRLVTLSEAARQMEELIVRLEKEREERAKGYRATEFIYETGNFAAYKGTLEPPSKGKITESFGWKKDPITYLKSFSSGIEITGKKSGRVVATVPGVIAYVGYLRGYGNFVIIEHEDGYYSTIAGIGSLYVEKYQIVEKADILGVTETGIVKYELRHGREPIDPVEWIKIESLK